MTALRRISTLLWFVLCGWAATLSPAAAVGNSCSVSGSTSVSIGNYNAFSGTGFTQVPVNLNLTRYANGNGRTQSVDFYLSLPAGTPAGYDVRYQNSSVLYIYPTSHPLSLTGLSGTVFYAFGGSGQPDTVSLPFVVTIPPNLDLTAGSPLVFDIYYVCSGAGGLGNVNVPTKLSNAITLQMNILSVLQASYAGANLDFGEIGALSDAQALQRTISGAIRVASTGPYGVTVSSANGYRMTYPGGSLATASQTIHYSAHLLGQTLDSTQPNFSGVSCSRAGTAGQNLPLSVTLREGGQTKRAASNYLDSFTVTVTPLAAPYGGATLKTARVYSEINTN